VINEAKKQHYRKILEDSTNKIKKTWQLVKENMGKHYHDTTITKIKIKNTILTNSRDIAQALNYY
jgi:hypothetical protein